MRGNCLPKTRYWSKKIKKMGTQGRRHKHLLDNRKEGRSYWNLKAEALDRTLRGARFGRGYGSVQRQTV